MSEYWVQHLMSFDKSIHLSNWNPCQDTKHCHAPSEVLSWSFPVSPSSCLPRSHPFLFCSYNRLVLPVVELHVNEACTVCVFLCKDYFHHNGPEIHPCCGFYPSSIGPLFFGARASWHSRMFQGHLVCSLYQPWDQLSLPGTLAPVCRHRFWVPCIFVVPGMSLLLGTFSLNSKGKTHMCAIHRYIHMCIYPHLFLCICIHVCACV